MSYKLKELLEKRKSGQLFVAPVHGGDENVTATLKSKEETSDLIFFQELEKIIKANNFWLTIVFAVIGVLVAFLLVLVWIWQDDKEYVSYLLAGEGVGVGICIQRLVHLYKQKRHSELLMLLYRTASSPADKTKVIDAMLEFLTVEKK